MIHSAFGNEELKTIVDEYQITHVKSPYKIYVMYISGVHPQVHAGHFLANNFNDNVYAHVATDHEYDHR